MDYRNLLKENNESVRERFDLSVERIREILDQDGVSMQEAYADYFKGVASLIDSCVDLYEKIEKETFFSQGFSVLQQENHDFYEDIMPKSYEMSYGNPAYAVKVLGEEHGRILSFLYTELRSLRVYAFEQNLEKFTILIELFVEIYCQFEEEKVSYKQVKDIIYWFIHDNADIFVEWRVRELLDPELDFARSIVMDSDLSDLSYLFAYGEYISEDEIKMAQFLNGLPQDKIDEIAYTFTKGYQQGFLLKGVDLSKKSTVNIRYNIGFERVIRQAITYFREMGLEPTLYRSAVCTLNKRQNIKIGYQSTNPNPQFDYDHRFDDAIYFDKRMVDRKISCMRKAYEEFEQEAAGFAGPAYIDVFGEVPFEPESKPEAYHLSERQQNLQREYSVLSNHLINEFINQEERSFTIIAYPMPSIGENFAEIFEEIHKVNTLDNRLYKRIQQRMIDVLDKGECVRITGRKENMTNLTISLHTLEDPKTQTIFENCLADVNIPVGEVFTSPKLTGTNGLLHVLGVYLNGLYFKDLRLTFEDGKIVDYSCGNYEEPEEGRRYIEDNLLFGHETLPIGEFAIGTNTTAHVMAQKYNISEKLPILIAEKMGPHLAVGDTCYSYCEDVRVFNPDGKEIVAKDNECSLLRKEDSKKAYFNCHTDITIPYEELGQIAVVTKENTQIPILINGRFVLDGTLELNAPFESEIEV